ncbi:hypothetical protein [Lacinutrix venerupis]|uniref:Lipocalin-like domain-containing protein n=1 Tax=Lacinutrix venerupis TaxID=1486034 RepID=A0AAC9LPM0_9FLAO|nr:hypothetical protein [Lacinutrix venerupis]APY01413.1 hypothetical protein BWR22_14240 [Lacinutrix venerupis]
MKFIIPILFLIISFSAEAQEKNFPEDYFGIYKGDLHITNAKGKQSIGMEFHLTATDSAEIYNYKIVYIFNGERNDRNYTLKTVDKDKGEYIIDENNGIILGAKLVDNVLYNVFEVQGNLLMTTEAFYNDYMTFEIVFSGKDSKTTTKATEDDTEVISYPITVTQKARLLKQ